MARNGVFRPLRNYQVTKRSLESILRRKKTISIASAAWSATNWNSKKKSFPIIHNNESIRQGQLMSLYYLGKKETFHFPLAEKERKKIVTIASDFCKSLFFWCKLEISSLPTIQFVRLLGIYETTIIDLPKKKCSSWHDYVSIE